MKKLLVLFSFFLLAHAFPQEKGELIACKDAIKRMMEGNKRFRADQSTHPDRVGERRLETARLQEPYAVIVGCSDSRVAPEIIFDQGIGDLFIVRVAGNVIGPLERESIEYSALVLHSCLIVVLGHENCGAVKAVLEGQTASVQAIAQLIDPAVEKARNQKDPLEYAIKQNVKNMVDVLKKNPNLSPLIKQDKLAIMGGYYNFHTGEVEILKIVD